MNSYRMKALLLLPAIALAVVPVRAQGPVQFPDATNAPSTNAPAAISPLNSTLSSPAGQTAPGWLQPPATPGKPSPLSPAQDRGPAGDIHDIRGPISIPYQWFWPVVAAVSLLAAAAVFLVWKFFPRRLLVHVKTPYEIALERLDSARTLMKTETVREYAFTVSEVIRVYIEQRFGETAARRTTEEFISDLIGQAWSPLAAHRGRLEEFLNHCDLIKFARCGATTREMELMHESARAFILETQPTKESPVIPAGGNPPAGAEEQRQLAQAK